MLPDHEILRRFPGVTPLLLLTIKAMVLSIKRTFGRAIADSPVMMESTHPLVRLVGRYSTGCSAATQVLLKANRLKWEWGPVPRSFKTFREDGILNIMPQEFIGAFMSVRQTCLLPAVQWTSLQILTRTLWTNLKESNTARGEAAGNTGLCANCFNGVESTLHLMYECRVASRLLDDIVATFNSVYRNHQDWVPLIKTHLLTMFYQVNKDLPLDVMQDIKDVFAIAKHICYTLRFRERADVPPRRIQTLILVSHEIGKLIKCRFVAGKDALALSRVNDGLKSLAGIA